MFHDAAPMMSRLEDGRDSGQLTHPQERIPHHMAQTVEQTDVRSQRPDGVAALEGIDIRKSLRLGRDRIDILNGISLRVEHGEFVAIGGPSGSGKSTLPRII